MDIEITGRASDVNQELRAWTTTRVAQKFRHFTHWLERAVVRMGDINGPKGGVDKFVTLELRAVNGQVTRTAATAEAYEIALARVLERAKRVLLRSPDWGSRTPRRSRTLARVALRPAV